MQPALHPLLIAFLLVFAACTTSRTQWQNAPEEDVITQEETQAVGASVNNAYELVRRLHPEWLQKRGRDEQGDIVVYVNDYRAGGPGALRDVPIESVAEVRFLDAAAAVRYGTGHQHGVILVQTL